MLCLTRYACEEIKMTGGITIKVISLSPSKVKLGITAPESINVWRAELPEEGSHTKQPVVRGESAKVGTPAA